MNPALLTYGVHFSWRCMTSFTLFIRITHVSSHHRSLLIVLLNLLLCQVVNFRFHFVGAVYVGLEPVWMIFGVFGAPPALYRVIGPTCCLSYGLSVHNRSHGCSFPPGIFSASRGGEWWIFSVPSSKIYFLIPEFIRLSPWVPLVRVPLNFHKPLI